MPLRARSIVLAASLASALIVPIAAPLAAQEAPSRFGVDAPELAGLGPASVGVRTLILIEHAQVDLSASGAQRGAAPRHDRVLKIDLWYPALTRPADLREVYRAAFPAEPPAPPVHFSVTGIAVRNAPAAGSGYPLVIVSHGHSNSPAAMTWITENLASKGYVVAAIRHEDPPLTDAAGLPELLLMRPLDIAFAAKTLQRLLAARRLVDPMRTALIGYSMGGYGVLTAAGATLDAAGRTVQLVPGGLLLPFASGGAMRDAITVPGLRAVVAISPAGGGELGAWGADGLRTLTAPLLLISGDQDRVVGYASGARGFFDAAVNADRYLLTFRGAGHSIGLNPAPAAMRHRLWDQDWFEDPVWSKQRINAISAHFITAFLDRHLKGDESRAAYLDVAVPESGDGVWPASTSSAYAAFSPGGPDVTVWKGFQRNHSAGLELLRAAARSP